MWGPALSWNVTFPRVASVAGKRGSMDDMTEVLYEGTHLMILCPQEGNARLPAACRLIRLNVRAPHELSWRSS